MTQRTLADTLTGLVESLEPPEGSGLRITEATLDVPLEAVMVWTTHGPLFHASLPHTRWLSGFLPPVHMAHLDVVAWTPDEDDGER